MSNGHIVDWCYWVVKGSTWDICAYNSIEVDWRDDDEFEYRHISGGRKTWLDELYEDIVLSISEALPFTTSCGTLVFTCNEISAVARLDFKSYPGLGCVCNFYTDTESWTTTLYNKLDDSPTHAPFYTEVMEFLRSNITMEILSLHD